MEEWNKYMAPFVVGLENCFEREVVDDIFIAKMDFS